MNKKGIIVCLAWIVLICGVPPRVQAQETIYDRIADSVDIVVDASGAGDYLTVQEAIDAVPINATEKTVIFVGKGTYKEKILVPENRANIVLIGESAEHTILTYDDYSGRIVDGTEIGTSTSYSFAADADDFTAMNLTFENSAGDVGQAVALRTNGDRQTFVHCILRGFQDTYYTWGYYRNYLRDCRIIGATDYVFGRTTTVFDSCQIHSLKSGSYITAASTEEGVGFGYVFRHCRLTATAGISGVHLGRPWRPYAQTVYMWCDEGDFLDPEGWSIWNGNENHTTCFYAEYQCFGPGSDTVARVEWSHQLTDDEAEGYTVDSIFSVSVNPARFGSDWNPDLENNFFYQAVVASTRKFLDTANRNAGIELLRVNEETVVMEENKSRYIVELPDGTTEMPVIEVIPEDSLATAEVEYPEDFPGEAIVTVLSADETVSHSVSVFLSVGGAASNSRVGRLRYNYTEIDGFDPDIHYYAIYLEEETTRKPTIQADPEIEGATILITRPEDLPGVGYALCTSYDSTAQTEYTVEFFLGPNSVEQQEAAGVFRISNPFRDRITLYLPDSNTLPEYFMLWSVDGKIHFSCAGTDLYHAGNIIDIDIPQLSPGAYVFSCKVGDVLYTGTLMNQ